MFPATRVGIACCLLPVACLLLFFLSTSSAVGAERAVALGLFSEDPSWDYRATFFREIQRTGATHIAIVVPWYQSDVAATRIGRHPRFTAPDDTVLRVLREAKEDGFRTILFPIVRLEKEGGGDWRGTLRPTDAGAWRRSYAAFLERMAALAAQGGAETVVLGSELATMDVDPAPWRALAANVRRRFPGGSLVYSANWDHYDQVGFWDAVDRAGVTGYFELTAGERAPTMDRLVESWRETWVRLMRFAHRTGKPLAFTELGYLSQDGTNAWPWKEGADEAIDLEEQRMCFEAFRRVWAAERRLGAAWIWNWFGWGGVSSKEYTPRGKPAEAEVARLFAAL